MHGPGPYVVTDGPPPTTPRLAGSDWHVRAVRNIADSKQESYRQMYGLQEDVRIRTSLAVRVRTNVEFFVFDRRQYEDGIPADRRKRRGTSIVAYSRNTHLVTAPQSPGHCSANLSSSLTGIPNASVACSRSSAT